MKLKTLALGALCWNLCPVWGIPSIELSTTPESDQFVFRGNGIVLAEYSRDLNDWERLATDPSIFLLSSARYTLKSDDWEQGIFVRAREIDPVELSGAWSATREIVPLGDCEYEGELVTEFECEVGISGAAGFFWSIQIQSDSVNAAGFPLFLHGPVNKDGTMILSWNAPMVCNGLLEIVGTVGDAYITASEDRFEIALVIREPHCEGATCEFESVFRFEKDH